MSIRRLVAVGILVAAAFALASALLTHDGVGVVEWVVGVGLVLTLVTLAARLTLRARLG
jgi:hypothetical protein